MSLLEINNINKSYGKKKVLNNINIKVSKGKIIGLLGPNGSGKTTLIKIINGLLLPNDGVVLVNNEKIGINSKKVISYLPEKTYLDLNMKVSEIINFFSDFYEDFDRDKAYNLLEKLDLCADDKLNKMSKGMKEKVQLILVMSRKADLYILDEPIGGVDPATRDFILDTILTNFSKKSSMIISTHLINDVEKILDEVIFIKNGEIYLTKQAEKLKKEKKKSIDEIFREEFKC